MDINRLGLSKDDLHQIVTKHYASCEKTRSGTQWRVVEANIQPFSSCPDGFLSDHYTLTVTVETEIRETVELSFFVKSSPDNNPALTRYLQEIGAFDKERHVLKDMVTVIQQYCPWRTIAPNVYCAKGLSLLVMNDAKSQGFSVMKRESGLLDGSFLRQALKTLACLHAGSFLMERKYSKPLLELFPKILDENAWVTTSNSTRLKDVANVIQLYSELIPLCGKWQGSQKDAILAQLPKLFRTIYNYTVPSIRFPNCLNHGDLWCNNIMFKCNDKGEPTECILVDYQLSRYVPPAYDINLLLYLTSSRQLRNEQREALLEHYYYCFSEVLLRNQEDAASILPRSTFLESCEYYILAGLIHSTMISGEVTLPDVFLQEVFNNTTTMAGFMPEQKVKVCIKAFRDDSTYRNHLLELMEELFSYINPST